MGRSIPPDSIRYPRRVLILSGEGDKGEGRRTLAAQTFPAAFPAGPYDPETSAPFFSGIFQTPKRTLNS